MSNTKKLRKDQFELYDLKVIDPGAEKTEKVIDYAAMGVHSHLFILTHMHGQ